MSTATAPRTNLRVVSSRPRIVLVTGSGRSGTSSVAGTLKRLGLQVPQPEVEADEKNPRGYYEPLWVTEFHKRVLNPVPVRTIDTRPHALEVAAAAVADGQAETELRDWLSGQLDAGQVLIKDPRAFWILPVWRKVAADLGADIVTLTMLRHPSEVVRSRDTAYLSEQTKQFRRQRETANVAAWVNAAHLTELATRDLPRAFVAYHDLLADWRQAVGRAGEQLGITLDFDGGSASVDEFIDAKLNRSAISWDDLSVPPVLRGLGDRTWKSMNALIDNPHDGEAMTSLEQQRESYIEVFEWSEAIAMDATAQKVHDTRLEVRRNKQREIDAVRRELAQARQQDADGGFFRRLLNAPKER